MEQLHKPISKQYRNTNLMIILSIFFLIFAKYGPSWGSLTTEGTITLAVMIVMAIFWVLEPIPIYATALVPLAIFPLFKVDTFQSIANNYANSNIYLFFGGFVLALAMEASGIHKRISLKILNAVGPNPANIIGGFILAPGILSMWISNTATTVLMMPIAFSVLDLLKENTSEKQYKAISVSVILSIAFSSSIGGLATFIGTPPNAIFAAFARDNGIHIGFAQFMKLGIPLAFGGFIILWVLFTKIIFTLDNKPIEGSKELFAKELKALSKMSFAEKMVLWVFIITASLWIFRQVITKYVLSHMGLTLTDPGIAMVAALTLFLLPNGNKIIDHGSGNRYGRILTWQDTSNLPWGILLLFGGGLALGQQIQKTGVGEWIATGIQGPLSNIPLILIIAFIAILVSLLSQFASNTATTAALLPIFFPVAEATNIHPLFIMLPLTIGASSVFMLPSATPPNAIVISYKGMRIKDMFKYGGILNLVFILFVIIIIYIFLKFNIAFDTGDGTFEYFKNNIIK